MSIFKKKLLSPVESIVNESLSKEQQLVERFITHAEFLASATITDSSVLSLQIVQTNSQISVALCGGKKIIKSISLKELALFFTDPTTALLIPRHLINNKLKTYFGTLEKSTHSEVIGLRLIILKNKSVKIYTIGTPEIKEISLDAFVHFFMP